MQQYEDFDFCLFQKLKNIDKKVFSVSIKILLNYLFYF